MTYRYYYPEDIIKHKGGTATVGYSEVLKEDGTIGFLSELPVEFTKEELLQFDSLYFRIWEGARLRERGNKTIAYLKENHPEVLLEKLDYEEFVKRTGNHSITAWRMAKEEKKSGRNNG